MAVKHGVIQLGPGVVGIKMIVNQDGIALVRVMITDKSIDARS